MSAVIEAIETLQERGELGLSKGRIVYRGAACAEVEQAINILRRNRNTAIAALAASESGTIPPAEAWPESLAELANERAAQSGDLEAARKEVWISWCEWKARALNRLFLEHGLTGEPGRITAETVRDGTKRAARRREETS
jgi:hypothetical protein